MRIGRRQFARGLAAAALAATLLSAPGCTKPVPGRPDLARWESIAERVTIARDEWGIPHVHGRTDAGRLKCVFILSTKSSASISCVVAKSFGLMSPYPFPG